MPTLSDDERKQNIIAQGRAMVRLIEACDVLVASSGSWRESWLLKTAQGLYRHRLKRLVARLPTDVSAEILAASDKIGGGPTHDVSLN